MHDGNVIRDNIIVDCDHEGPMVTAANIEASVITNNVIKAGKITSAMIVANSIVSIDWVKTHCYQLQDGRLAHMPVGKLIVGSEEMLTHFGLKSWTVVPIPDDNTDETVHVVHWVTEFGSRPISHNQCLKVKLGCQTTALDNGEFDRVHSVHCNLHEKWSHLWDKKDVTRGETID